MVTVSTQEAVGSAKFVALYFSAHCKGTILAAMSLLRTTVSVECAGCPPCRGFTPVFAESYKAQGDDKEVQVSHRNHDTARAAPGSKVFLHD